MIYISIPETLDPQTALDKAKRLVQAPELVAIATSNTTQQYLQIHSCLTGQPDTADLIAAIRSAVSG